MKTVSKILLFLALLTYLSFSQDKFYEIRLYPGSEGPIKTVSELGLDYESITRFGRDSFDIILSKQEFNSIKNSLSSYSILSYDIASDYERKLGQKYQLPDQVLNEENFVYGTMAGFYRLDEIYTEFQKMIAKYPGYFLGYKIIGYTYENRPVYAYSFGAKPDSPRPKILLTALHHAREPQGAVVLVYFLWKLLENASKGDLLAEYILDNRELHIIPVVNPDGYAYNEKVSPGGGGVWRKNRKKLNDSTWGVDLNRNYGPTEFWDSPKAWSSDKPVSVDYRGPAPFSELETQAVRDYCLQNHFDIAVNFHSYGNLVIYPYSALASETPDSSFYRRLSSELTGKNGYYFGLDSLTVGYRARGTSDDWMYKSAQDKNKIFSFTIEVGNDLDGFWLTKYSPEERLGRILDIARENYFPLLETSLSAEENIRPVDLFCHYNDDGNPDYLNLELNNIGIKDLLYETSVKISASDPHIQFSGNLMKLSKLDSGKDTVLHLPISIDGGLKNGSKVDFEVSVISDKYPRSDTFQLYLSHPEVIDLLKDSSSFVNWNTDSWGLEFDNNSKEVFLSDSPGKAYTDSARNYIYYSQALDLSDALSAYIQFYVKWSIDRDWDVAVMQVSTDKGNTWEYLSTTRMTKGIGKAESMHNKGIPAFTGTYPYWIRQVADLRAYTGRKILLRFGLLSGQSVQLDGILLKNISIFLFKDKVNSIKETDKVVDRCSPVIINFGEIVRLPYFDVPLDSYSNLNIYDMIGRCRTSIEPASYGVESYYSIDTKALGTGFYFAVLDSPDGRQTLKLLIIEK